MFGKAGLGKLLKQTQDMQNKMKEAQTELAHLEVTGEAGAGAVKVVQTCQHVTRRVQIEDDSLLQDKEMLEDLLIAALNDANNKAEAKTKEHMSKITQGLPIPPGMTDFFK